MKISFCASFWLILYQTGVLAQREHQSTHGHSESKTKKSESEFLLYTTNDSIKSIKIYNTPDDHLLTAKDSNATTLISGLKNPTYLDYSAEFLELFVCESGTNTILHFDLRINEGVLNTSQKQILMRDIDCGGLRFDVYHNLYFVDRTNFEINKIPYEEIFIHNTKFGQEKDGGAPNPQFEKLYNSKNARELVNVDPICIEKKQEFLYWGNSLQTDGGTIHMGFTEPFIKAIPFQTYVFDDLAYVSSIATNDNFLFFISELSTQSDMGQGPSLFIQMKQSRIYDQIRVSENLLNMPSAVATYDENVLLIANKGFISQVDLSQHPVLFKQEHLVELDHTFDTIMDMTFVSKYQYYRERLTYYEIQKSAAAAMVVISVPAMLLWTALI